MQHYQIPLYLRAFALAITSEHPELYLMCLTTLDYTHTHSHTHTYIYINIKITKVSAKTWHPKESCPDHLASLFPLCFFTSLELYHYLSSLAYL
jgi:hypothetical protein